VLTSHCSHRHRRRAAWVQPGTRVSVDLERCGHSVQGHQRGICGRRI